MSNMKSTLDEIHIWLGIIEEKNNDLKDIKTKYIQNKMKEENKIKKLTNHQWVVG